MFPVSFEKFELSSTLRKGVVVLKVMGETKLHSLTYLVESLSGSQTCCGAALQGVLGRQAAVALNGHPEGPEQSVPEKPDCCMHILPEIDRREEDD